MDQLKQDFNAVSTFQHINARMLMRRDGIHHINKACRKTEEGLTIDAARIMIDERMAPMGLISVDHQYDLQQIDWETILTPFASDPSAMADTFQEIFESLLNVHAPI